MGTVPKCENGKIKVKRGTPKDTYKTRIKVTAAMTADYAAASEVVAIKVTAAMTADYAAASKVVTIKVKVI